jgi:hypothetical protein
MAAVCQPGRVRGLRISAGRGAPPGGGMDSVSTRLELDREDLGVFEGTPLLDD